MSESVEFICCKKRLPEKDRDMQEFLVRCLIRRKRRSSWVTRVAIFEADDQDWLHIDDYSPLHKVSAWAELPKGDFR